MIYSYIDTLLEKWVEWSEGFLSQKLEFIQDINTILGTTGADNPTRANELYKIGLLKYSLTGKGKENEGLNSLKNDIPVHSNLGYLSYLIKKALNIDNKNKLLNNAFTVLKTLYFIQQYEIYRGKFISLNYIINKLIERFPIPTDSDEKYYLRYLTTGMFCELHTNKDFFIEKILNDNIDELRIIDKDNNIVTTFKSSNDILLSISNKISLTGIQYEKGSVFLIGNPRDTNPRGLLFAPFVKHRDFLKDAYILEKDNFDNNPFDNIFNKNNNDVLFTLNKIFRNNNYYKIIMKTLKEGSLEALQTLEWLINEPIKIDDDNFNIIFFGPPGTGKSHNADILTKGYPTEKVTFHPEYDYNSFVGGYKPITDDEGNIKYQFVPQIFTNVYVEAWNNPNQTHFLQIEEINRGNVASIFGDLFQLLDRDENGYSKYKVSAEEELKKYLDHHLNDEGKKGIAEGKLQLPNNLRIVATMNTSDQSLFPIDSAFKRRWKWKFVPIDYNLSESDFIIKLDNGKKYKWLEFIQAVNNKIYEITQSPDKQIGNFFVNAIYSDKIINEETFLNKVLFYLWNDIFKDENETIFLDENNDKIYFEKIFEYDVSQKSEIVSRIIENLGISQHTENTEE